jgi:hypothetical protein
METEGSLPCTHRPVTFLCLEKHEFNSLLPILFPCDPFYYYPSIYAWFLPPSRLFFLLPYLTLYFSFSLLILLYLQLFPTISCSLFLFCCCHLFLPEFTTFLYFLTVFCLFLSFIFFSICFPLVESLRYKLKGRGFDSRWCHWKFSLT